MDSTDPLSAVIDIVNGDNASSPMLKGIGSIPFEGHVRMVGAIQSFISGAISKTNNLPETATVKDIYDGYLLGHELGLKALSVFRSNSKPTAALSFGLPEVIRELKRGEKEELPSRRKGLQTEVKIDGVPLHVNFGDYPDGTIIYNCIIYT